MTTVKQNILEGWLQDAYESADTLLGELHTTSVPFSGDAAAYCALRSALAEVVDQIDKYRAHCLRDYSEPDHKAESDPGPSQEQRL